MTWLRKIAPTCICAFALPAVAHAGLVVSPLVVDLLPSQPPRADVEMFNSGSDKLYVVVEAGRIEDAGLPGEHRVQSPDPAALGLIATPGRVILEPGQRKFLRLAALAPAGPADRVFRVTVKPVVGEVTGGPTGLKLLVGYDMLVLQRARDPKADIIAMRSDTALRLRNAGNTNAELFRGRQCRPMAGACSDLPTERLYPGSEVTLPVQSGWKVNYAVKVMDKVTEQNF